MKLKYGKVDEVDYQSTESGIRGLQLLEEERVQLRSLLSRNWTVQEEEVDGKTVLHIELV